MKNLARTQHTFEKPMFGVEKGRPNSWFLLNTEIE